MEILARVILKKNVLGFAKFSDYIKRQLLHWNGPMVYQSAAEHTSNPPELLFKQLFCIYTADLWEKTHAKSTSEAPLKHHVKHLRHYWSHAFALLFPVNLQYVCRIPFLKRTSGWLLARTPIAQATQYLLCKNPVDLRMLLPLSSREIKIQ